MNIEEVRDYALSMDDQVTERLFADKWLSWEDLRQMVPADRTRHARTLGGRKA